MGGGTPPQWLVDFLAAVGLDDIAVGVVAIVGGVVAVWLFTKRVWPVVRAIPAAVVTFARGVVTTAQVLESVKDLPAFIERTDARIGEIHHEVHFNNGSSVKDAAIRTERAVGELTATAQRLEEGVAGLYKRVDELAEVDDRLWATVDPEDEEADG